MANTTTGMFQTVVAAFSEATRLLRPTHAAKDAIYWDHRPDQTGVLGQTLNVMIPADPTGAVQDIGINDGVLSDIAFTTTPIVYNKHPWFAYVVRDYEQFNTPYQIRMNFLDAAITGIHNNINQQVCNLFTSSNFTTNPTISATNHIITVPQFQQYGWSVLADQRVPVQTDVRNMHLLLPSTPYSAMLDPTTGGGGAAWAQAFIIGEKTASTIHDTGTIPVAFGTQVQLDQQMPTTGTVGSRTFTGAYFHSYAIAGVSRAIGTPSEAMKVVDLAYMDFGGLSIRIQMGYNQYPKGGPIITIDCGYGLAVVRQNMGVLASIAE